MQVNFNTTKLNSVSSQKIKNVTPSFGSDTSKDEVNILGSLFSNIFSVISGVMKKLTHERNVENYITALSSKQLKSQLNQLKNMKIEELNYIILPNNSAQEYINSLFKEAGINNGIQLVNFLRIYTQNSSTPKVFKNQNIEAVKIYKYLNNKYDISSFPNLLLYLYNQEEDEDNPNFNKLNTYTDILKKSGIKNESEIDEKLSYLKPEFNNFESDADKVNAIKYLQETYDAKIALLNDILKANPKLSKQNSEKVYYELSDIVNYLYLKNDGKSLNKLQEYIEKALDFGKIKTSARNRLNKNFGELNTPEEKISLLEVMNECNVSVNEINIYTKKNIISDSDLLDIIISKESICNQIHANEPQVLFNDFNAILTAVYTKGCNKEDTEAVDTLIDVINANKIKDQNSFLSFYNTVHNTKEKSLTTKQVSEFIDLYRYSDKKDITDLKTLEQNKAKFDAALPFIENFLRNEASDYFIGKSPLEIYKEFNYCADFSSSEKIQNLNDIAVFHQNNSEQTQKSQEAFNNFRKYFNSKQSALDFLIQNKIKFDDSQESEQYRNQCLEILNILSTDPKKTQDRIEKITQTGFLPNSKNILASFTAQYKDSGQLNSLIKIIADKKVPSVKDLNKFFKTYQNASGEYNNLIKHLYLIPDDMDFTSYTTLLNALNNVIKQYQIPRNIDNDNILNIDINKYKPRKIKSVDELNNLFCLILNQKSNTSFIEGLKSTYTNAHERYSSYKIAKEIVNKIDTTNESYKNLARELKLDKESLRIPADCDNNTYIYAIKESLPKEFIDFINSNDWLNFNNDENKIPNITLHARLRLTDRIALTSSGSIKELYSDSTKEKLRNTLKSIYTQTPKSIKGREDSHRIVIQTPYNDKKMESVFSNKGELITAIPVN